MAIQVRAGGAWRTISGLQIYANGAWRNILQVQVYSGGAWRVVANYQPPQAPPAPSMSLSISPPSQGVSGSTTPMRTDYFTAIPTGGVAPYTYRWSITDSDGAVSIVSPTLASTKLTAALAPGDIASASASCTATDSLNQSASAECFATFSRS